MILGAIPALLFISLFVFTVDRPNPDWGKYWFIRPLIITPLAGAAGGLVYYFFEAMRVRGWNRILTTVASILIYIIGLWMGIVLGLAGTLWN